MDFDDAIVVLVAGTAGVVLPFVLMIVIAITGHSVIVEEAAKALVVLSASFTAAPRRSLWVAALVFGLAFGLSETGLYLGQLFQNHGLAALTQRLFLTIPMHAVTVSLLMACVLRDKRLLPLGLACAIWLHMTFNSFV